GRPKTSDDTRELRAYALAAMDLLEKGGMPADKAEEEIRLRFKEAGVNLARSALRNWRNECGGFRKPGAKALRAVMEQYAPDASRKADKPAHWIAAGSVPRELDILIHLS